jgi:hypothetical protein
MAAQRTRTPIGRRVREWLARYLPAEVAAVSGALVAAGVAHRLAGPAAAALAGSIGESVAFYAVIVVRDLRRGRASHMWLRNVGRIARNMVLEFGPAELIDTFVVRPTAMYLGPVVVGRLAAGVVLGKIAADVVFYALAIIGYELRKAAAARRRRDEMAAATHRRRDELAGAGVASK